jgi:hypothetical protein
MRALRASTSAPQDERQLAQDLKIAIGQQEVAPRWPLAARSLAANSDGSARLHLTLHCSPTPAPPCASPSKKSSGLVVMCCAKNYEEALAPGQRFGHQRIATTSLKHATHFRVNAQGRYDDINPLTAGGLPQALRWP